MSGIATPGCSDRTIRRRVALWAGWGLAGALHAAALRAYDQVIGPELGDIAVDGCMTKAPCTRPTRGCITSAGIAAALGFLTGAGLLLAGVVIDVILIAVAGFVVMLACSLWAVTSYRRMAGITTRRVPAKNRASAPGAAALT